MTLSALPQLAVAWIALLAATGAVLLPPLNRWAWWVASMALLAWLALAGSAPAASLMAIGSIIALVVDAGGREGSTGFGGVVRSIIATGVAYIATIVLLVRLAHAEFTLALQVFPVVAAGLLAVAELLNARGEAELLRVSRLLVVLAAVVAVVSGQAGGYLLPTVAAAALPLLAAVGRLRTSGAGR